jgi:hypothetical protein
MEEIPPFLCHSPALLGQGPYHTPTEWRLQIQIFAEEEEKL